MATKKISNTARAVRDALLSHGPDAINRLVYSASGFEVKEDGTKGEYNPENVRPELLFQIVQRMLPMIALEDDLEDSNELKSAKTIEELQQLHKQGHITIKQLQQYTQIIKTNYEITELPQLMAKLEEMENRK